MIKPIRLFGGVEQKDQKVVFVNVDGLGFWFTSLGERTIGEAEILRGISEDIESYDASNNRLILEIIHKNKELLTQEIKTNNPDSLSPEKLEKLAGRDLTLALEAYVRKLISDLELTHPALYPFINTLTSFDPAKLMLNYQLACVRVAFLKRYVSKPEIISQSPDDPEIGYIPYKTVVESGIIGINPDEFTYDDLGEPLALAIYNFIQDEFRGTPFKSTKTKEAEKAQASAQLTQNNASISEGKLPVTNELQTSKEIEIVA